MKYIKKKIKKIEWRIKKGRERLKEEKGKKDVKINLLDIWDVMA